MFMEVNDDYSEKLHYDYYNYPIYVQEGKLSDYLGYRALVHWHDDIELIYILSGEMQYNINGEIISIRQGNGLFVNARQMHFGFSANKTECIFICIRIHPMLLCMNAQCEKDFITPILTNPNIRYIPFLQEIEWHNELLQYMPLINSVKNSKTAQLKINSYLLQIWSLLYENTPCTSKNCMTNFDFSALKDMISFIQRNYTEKITLSDIASSANVGQSKCCRLFSKYLGQTPNNYLIDYRLQNCVELLQSTDMSITEISVATGFGSGSYFAETFRKKYGTTPTNYKKKLQ